ncbi:DUF4268 domain-containing protein [Mesobacterium pallidum]|uniref:DUF4268 domain-containing protein n=1 Tax=Mesobacterium pallidum TaxID=2872037 RepID=UPI001EE35898|nr:DUF4268 domain-containing protein [Mesobacterium pallidum]
MSTVAFGTLEDLQPRDAWTNEARDFTPWLAENIDQLSKVIGVPLELTGTEVAVQTFAADILARNMQDGSTVLIENQLEQTDHSHLGQILTYLAGLDAQTVIWIAPRFRDAHRSAIRWLNAHTADNFAFFAVRLRVVRIGDSPFAPVFEIVEEPDDWAREIKHVVAPEGSRYYDIKQEFWNAFLDRYPELEQAGLRRWRYPNNYLTAHDTPGIEVSVYLGKERSGVFIRSAWGEQVGPVVAVLEPHKAALEARLGAGFGPSGRGGHILGRDIDMGHEARDTWPECMAWMHARLMEYRAALSEVLT